MVPVVFRTKLGDLELEEQDIILFEEGLLGFESLKKFAVVNLESTAPIQWLTSLESDQVAFPVVSPWLVRVDYSLNLSKEDVEQLQIESEKDVEVLVILTIPQDNPRATTANLLAPVVINKRLKKARQVIQEDTDYQIKHSVIEEVERSRKLMGNRQTGSE